MLKKLTEYILILVLLSPLVMLNIRDSHDWGDDFAMYMTQAQNIANRQPFYQSQFQYHDYNIRYAPPYYAFGYPLLLAPVVKIYGLRLSKLNIYMSLWVIAFGLLTFIYLREHLSLFTSTCLVTLFFLNPFFFNFKTYILADVPFSFFFTLSLLLYLKRSGRPLYYLIIVGFVLAFTVGIRSIGMLLIPLMLVDLTVQFIRFMSGMVSKEEVLQYIKETMSIVVSCMVFLFLFNAILFKAPDDLLPFFLKQYQAGHYWQTLIDNLNVYTYEYTNLFQHDIPKYLFISQYTKALMLVLVVLGLLHTIRLKHKFEIFLLISYCVVVLMFPFSKQGFRYLLPVLPIIILCFINGVRSIELKGYNKYLLAIVFVVLVMLQYKEDIKMMHKHREEAFWPGPQTDQNNLMLTYIQTQMPSNAVLACLKPRAVQLYTGHSTCVLPYDSTVPNIAARMYESKATHLLHIKDQGETIIEDLAAYEKDSLIWEDAGCKIYQRKVQ